MGSILSLPIKITKLILSLLTKITSLVFTLVILLVKLVFALVALYLLLYTSLYILRVLYRLVTLGYTIITSLPRYNRIPITDPIWSSEIYKETYESREKWNHIEGFVYEEFITFETLLPRFRDDREGCEREAMRAFWRWRNEQTSYKDPGEPFDLSFILFLEFQDV
jgi:hypothetical protein